MNETMRIVVRMTTLDGANTRGVFKTLAGARKFAQSKVGKNPDISGMFQYAVGNYGDVKVTCDGCKLADLFGDDADVKAAKYDLMAAEAPMKAAEASVALDAAVDTLRAARESVEAAKAAHDDAKRACNAGMRRESDGETISEEEIAAIFAAEHAASDAIYQSDRALDNARVAFKGAESRMMFANHTLAWSEGRKCPAGCWACEDRRYNPSEYPAPRKIVAKAGV